MTEPETLTRKQQQSHATQERLLTAASQEFQQHGLAGGRVDRIAATAGANKRLIYIYFGDKEGLFDAVVARHVEAMLDAVPLRADDLPGYAADLLGYLEDQPQVSRLFAYRNLERPTTSAAERESYLRKIDQIADAQEAGHIDHRTPPAQLLALVLGVVGSWAVASPALTDIAHHAGDRTARQELVRKAVRRLTARETATSDHIA